MVSTSDLNMAGERELKGARDLIDSYIKNGLPPSFIRETFELRLNPRTGFVFFRNSHNQSAILNPETGVIEMYYCTPSGVDGFLCEMKEMEGYMDEGDREWLSDIEEGNILF